MLKAEQRFFLNSTSLPFISGDGFKSLEGPFRSSADLNGERLGFVRFVKSDQLEKRLAESFTEKENFVLFVGNGDRDFFSFPSELPPLLKRVYLQNSFISDNGLIRTLPIGIENLKHAMNGKPKLMRSTLPFEKKRNEILIGPFGNTHHSRGKLLKLTPSKDLYIQHNRLKAGQFSELASTFKFVACPRGNGVDTHRLWETLYRGSIPIVIKDEWSNSLDYLNLPVLKVSDWTLQEMSNVVQVYKSTEIPSPMNLRYLWIDAWLKLIHKDLISSG